MRLRQSKVRNDDDRPKTAQRPPQDRLKTTQDGPKIAPRPRQDRMLKK